MRIGTARRAAPPAALLLWSLATAAAAVPMSSSFTYQGLLRDAGLPASARYDFEFRLFDAPTGGMQTGTTVTAADVLVTAGIFTVELNFGEPAFDGNERWLQIGVRPAASTAAYTDLARQRLAPAPYADNLLLPFRAEVRSATSLFDVTNPGPGRVAAFTQTDPLAAVHALRVEAAANASVAAAGFYATGSGNYALFAQSENAIAGYFNGRGAASSAPAVYAMTAGSGPAVRADGRLEVGSLGRDGAVDVLRSGSSLATVSINSDSHGGLVLVRDPSGNTDAVLAADADPGGGGWLAVARSAGSLYGVVIDGNVAGSTNPSLTLYGTARFAAFDMNTAGDAAVTLPNDAISATEQLDEPGVAGITSNTSMALAGGGESIASRSLTAPAAGYVLVWGTTEATVTHTAGTTSTLLCGVSTVAATLPPSQDHATVVPASAPAGTYSFTVSVHAVFPVSAGLTTLYLVAERSSGTWSVTNTQLTALYVATAYGTVSPSLTAAGDLTHHTQARTTSPARGALSSVELAAERAAASEFDHARWAGELAALQARLAALEAQLAAQRSGAPPRVHAVAPPRGGDEPAAAPAAPIPAPGAVPAPR
jgi:hypothetical protein